MSEVDVKIAQAQEINKDSMLTIEVIGNSTKNVKIVGESKGTKRYQEWNASANIKINEYEKIKVMVRPSISGSPEVMTV